MDLVVTDVKSTCLNGNERTLASVLTSFLYFVLKARELCSTEACLQQLLKCSSYCVGQGKSEQICTVNPQPWERMRMLCYTPKWQKKEPKDTFP